LTQKKSTKRKSQDFADFATTTNKIAKQNKVGNGSFEVLWFCTADWHFVFNAISLLSVYRKICKVIPFCPIVAEKMNTAGVQYQ
jgi:hypothetical protein